MQSDFEKSAVFKNFRYLVIGFYDQNGAVEKWPNNSLVIITEYINRCGCAMAQWLG